jgi:copper chaperone NosL
MHCMMTLPCPTQALPRCLQCNSRFASGAGLYIFLLVLALLLTGCGQPDGDKPLSIAWDRDTCEYCRMTISDRAYAAQAWVGPQHRYYKFDDIGCLVNWLHASGLPPEQVRLWVADSRHHDQVHWLDARTAWYRNGLTTPMDYGFGATDERTEGAVDFETAYAQILKRDERR